VEAVDEWDIEAVALNEGLAVAVIDGDFVGEVVGVTDGVGDTINMITDDEGDAVMEGVVDGLIE
jgi:hypothetical protein